MARMYDEFAHWWHLISSPEEYTEEAAFFLAQIAKSHPQATSLLELGSGGGNNASLMKAHFERVTLVDLAEPMLAVSRTLNPECEHVQGDMRSLRLEREFDVVFVHDAIMYMTTHDDLRRAMQTAFIHTRAGGMALFVPDFVRETFSPESTHGGQDDAQRGLRYLEWYYDPDPTDTLITTEFVYMLREGNQPTRIEHDVHITGIFPRADWLGLLAEVGFLTETVVDDYEREVFIAHKPR